MAWMLYADVDRATLFFWNYFFELRARCWYSLCRRRSERALTNLDTISLPSFTPILLSP